MYLTVKESSPVFCGIFGECCCLVAMGSSCRRTIPLNVASISYFKSRVCDLLYDLTAGCLKHTQIIVSHWNWGKLRKWNECLKDKGLQINEDKTKVMCESFGTGTTQVVGNVKHPYSVCLKGVGVNSIRRTQCIQWVHARCSRVKGSVKNVESSSFICRRCKGELYETRQVNSQVNGLHIDGHEYEIVDKFCYLGDMLS